MLEIYAPGDIFSLLRKYRDEGWQIVGLENNISKKKICELNDPKLGKSLKDKIVLVLGEEVSGINPELYDLIDLFVEIPMKGKKESFNVSVAAGIAMYGIMNL